MNDIQSLYLLWATILNQSQKAEQVLLNTVELFNRLGLKEDFYKKYKEVDYKKLEKVMLEKPCLHRFPKNMAVNLASSIYMLEKYYDGKPSKLFEKYEDTQEFKKSLMQFRGIGEHKADTAITIIQTYKKINNSRNILKSKCDGLYKTIGQEMDILDEFGDENVYDR